MSENAIATDLCRALAYTKAELPVKVLAPSTPSDYKDSNVYEDDGGHRKLVCRYRKERKQPGTRGHRKARGQTALFD